MIEKIYRKIRWLYPKAYIEWLEKNFIYAGMDLKIETFVVMSLFFSFSISLLLFSIVMYLGYALIAWSVFGLGFIGLEFVFNMFIVLAGDKKGGFAESVLPDALQLMSANIRSGLTPDKALLFSARPEFGALEKEIKLAASKAIAGEPIEKSLMSLGERIKSRIINRTFTLIVEGMRKGGEIASLLEHTAEDIRDLKILKKEIAAQVGMYTIFIFIAIGFASPLLFAFSSYLVGTMTAIGSKIVVTDISSYSMLGPLKLSLVKISPHFLNIFSLITLSITAFFGSLLIGLLQEGKEKAGIKYIPFLLLLDIGIYFGVRFVLSGFIGSIAPPII